MGLPDTKEKELITDRRFVEAEPDEAVPIREPVAKLSRASVPKRPFLLLAAGAKYAGDARAACYIVITQKPFPVGGNCERLKGVRFGGLVVLGEHGTERRFTVALADACVEPLPAHGIIVTLPDASP